MAERQVTLGMQFVADLTPARASVEQFIKEISGRGISIPIGIGGGGGPTSTLGGGSVGQSPSMPFGSANPNWSMMFTRMTQELTQGISAAVSRAVQAATAGVGQAGPIASGGGDGGGGGGGSRSFAMRGLTRYAGAGFALRTAFHGMEAYAAYNQGMMLAGAGGPQSSSDLRSEYDAVMHARASAPLGAGPLADFLEDVTGSRRGLSQLILRSATATDEASGGIVGGANFRRDLGFRAGAAATRPGYARERAGTQYGYASELMRIEAAKNAEMGPIRTAHEANQRLIQNREFTGGSGPDASGAYEDEFEARRNRDLASGQAAYGSQVAGVEARFQRSREDAERIRVSQLRDIEQRRTYDLQMAGVHTRSAQLRTQGRYSEASLYEKSQADYAAYQATDPDDLELRRSMKRRSSAEQGELRESLSRRLNTSIGQNLALARNDPVSAALIGIQGESVDSGARLAATIRTLAETQRRTALTTMHFTSSAASIGMLLNHDPLGARLNEIAGERAQALAALPSGWLFDMLGGSALRGGINRRADAAGRLARQQFGEGTADIQLRQQTHSRQLEALMNRNPMAASVAGIVGGAEEEARGLYRSGRPGEAKEALRLGSRSLDVEKQQYSDQFRAETYDLRLRSASNPRDVDNPGAIFAAINAGKKELENFNPGDKIDKATAQGFVDKIIQALKELVSGDN